MKRLEPQQMLGLRVMGKKGLDAYFLSEVLQILGIKSLRVDGKYVLVFSVIGGTLGFLGSLASILSFLGINLGTSI